MSSKTWDIHQFCIFAFYDWLMFRDQPTAYPNEKPVLDHYLGLAIDAGPTPTPKILKANGQVVNCLTYHQLTDTDLGTLFM